MKIDVQEQIQNIPKKAKLAPNISAQIKEIMKDEMKEIRKEMLEFFQKERDERIRLEKELNEKINKMEEDINYIKKMLPSAEIPKKDI